MRVDAVNPATGASLAVIARTAPQPDSSVGVHGGSAFYEASSGTIWQAELWYGGNGGDPLSASYGALPSVTSLDQTTFNPGHQWHTYRVEVRGPSYKLFIDGIAALAGREATFLFRPDQRAGLTADGCSISVSRFRILAL